MTALLSAGLSYFLAERTDPKADFPITRVAVSRSGGWIAVASESGWIGIFDHAHPDSPQRFRLATGRVTDLRFTPDEEWVVIAGGELSRHPAKVLGSTEPITKSQDTSEPQRPVSAPQGIDKTEITSNVVQGPEPGSVLFGNFAGSVEIHDRSGKLTERYTFR